MEPADTGQGPEDFNLHAARHGGSALGRALKLLAQLGLVAGILAYLICTDQLQLQKLESLCHGWRWVIYCFLLFLPSFFLCAVRFRLLLGALALPGTLWQTFSWTMIGSFFDASMPLSNGGDLIKVYYVARHAGKGKRGVALLSVVLDRIVGLLALFIFAWLVCLFAGNKISDNPDLHRLSHVLLIVCAASVALFFLLVSPWLERSAVRKRLMAWLPFHARLEAIYAAFIGLRQHKGTLILMMLLSLLVQLLGCLGLLCLAQALDFVSLETHRIVPLDAMEAMVVLPLAVFLNTFGMAGGFGVGEYAFNKLFMLLLGVSGGAELALAFHVIFLCTRLLGAPFVILYRHKPHS